MSFVEFTDCPQVVPPYWFPDTKFNMFWLAADRKNLQDWCELALNISPDHHFEALAPFVLLTVIDYPKMILEGREGLGYSRQLEYALMFPVVRFDNIFGLMIPGDVTWAVPFIGVDLVSSALAGQMVLGFPKSSGEIVVRSPPPADGSYAAVVKMPGMASLSKNAQQELLTIVEIQTGIPGPVTSGGSLLGLLPAPVAHDDFGVLALLQALVPGLYSLTNLKQIRDPADPPNPVYQALIRAEWQQSNIRDFRFYSDAAITVTDNGNVRIAEVLGLTGGSGASGSIFKAISAATVQCDLRLGNVTTVVQTA